MARMTPLWQQGSNYPATIDRLLLGALWPNGGASGPVPAAVANTMNVNIPAGVVAVPLQAGQGVALCRWDAAEVVTHDAATAQPRIDVVIAQVRDTALDAGPNNDFVFTIVKGTPAANPAVPPIPNNAYPMVNVTVPANAANLNAATITDRRGGTLDVAGCVAYALGPAIDAGQNQTILTVSWTARMGRRYKITGRCRATQIWAGVTANQAWGFCQINAPGGQQVVVDWNDDYQTGRGISGSSFAIWDQVNADQTQTASLVNGYGGAQSTSRYVAGGHALVVEDIGPARAAGWAAMAGVLPT